MFRKYHDPLTLREVLIQLRAGGVAAPDARPGIADPGLWTIGLIRAESDHDLHADVWERHPTGDEVLCALSGAVAVYLRELGDEPVATVRSGEGFIVPAGAWHRLELREPGELMAITPRCQTQHERLDASASAEGGAASTGVER